MTPPKIVQLVAYDGYLYALDSKGMVYRLERHGHDPVTGRPRMTKTPVKLEDR
jgi:hypothetical protein